METKKTYFFVDESGDPTFYNKHSKYIVGEYGSSPILILGFIKTNNPQSLRKAVMDLKNEILNDSYLQKIPSFKKTLDKGFHAKNDRPEIREKFFKTILSLDFRSEFYVARKIEKIFINRHKGKEILFYNDMIVKLFENKLHKSPENYIYFATRGNKKRQTLLEEAIRTAKLTFENKWGTKTNSDCFVIPQTPTGEPCIQIIDYLNWAIYRAFVKGEERYFEFIKGKISLVVDIYDFKNYPKNYYNNKNKFSIKKISPLQLG